MLFLLLVFVSLLFRPSKWVEEKFPSLQVLGAEFVLFFFQYILMENTWHGNYVSIKLLFIYFCCFFLK